MAYPYYNVDGTKSIHAWQANREYAIGDVVRANPSKGNTLAFKCIQLRAVAPGEKPKSDTEEFYATFPEKIGRAHV